MDRTPCYILLALVFLALPSPGLFQENKYTKEANTRPLKDPIINYRELEKPFRMSKLNLVWQKAVHKLSENKLKSLFTELQFQDKEELKLKRLKADGQDKDGIMEADVRRKFKAILNTFTLLEHFEEGEKSDKEPHHHRNSDNHINKSLFKDKKLNKLWEKAEKSGFNEKELKTLKEEFAHHQDKLDQYYMLMESLTNEEKNLMHNDIPNINHLLDDLDEPVAPGDKKQDSKLNSITTKHREIKDGYDELHKRTASGPDSVDFSEPRVQGLWKMALKADFSPDELNSLRTELKHYEKRIEKLQHFQAEYYIKKEFKDKTKEERPSHTDKEDTMSIFEGKIKRHERTVEKLHSDLESRILNRHSEL